MCFELSCSVVSNSLQPHAGQAPLSMELFRHEHWSRMPFPASRDLPDQGIEPTSLASHVLAGGFFMAEPSGDCILCTHEKCQCTNQPSHHQLGSWPVPRRHCHPPFLGRGPGCCSERTCAPTWQDPEHLASQCGKQLCSSCGGQNPARKVVGSGNSFI